MKDLLAKLSKLNDKYSMFTTITADKDAGDSKFLFSAKDGLTSKDMETKCGSRILEGYRPVFDATAIAKMREAGGKLIGKTNMDEFGFGSFSTNSPFGVPKNPYDLERSCGGSSGGAACAASVIEYHVALGVSTGGSVCCPASFCGVYGLVPTYGRVSRYGVIDNGNSLDKVGLLSSCPFQIAKFLPIISGKDPKDPTSCCQPELEIKGKKIKSVAVPENALDGLSKDVRSGFNASLDTLRGMGIDVEMITMPSLKYAIPAYYIIETSEASTNLASYVGMRYGRQDGDLSLKFDDYFNYFRTEYFGDETKRRIILGTYARMAGLRDRYYSKSLRVRLHIISSYKEILKEHDAVLTPTMPFVSPRFDEISNMSPVESYSADRLTVPPNLTGMPHMSVPCGYDGNGMPMGMQIVTDHWQEDRLLTFAKEWGAVFDVRRPEVPL
ncbi:amidase [Candidatus Methanoplasma termitum]|uniref:Amidase n=1 Tax=Candidatus Methanoplasma termitum TaxID=1577791 RepID=A0A0A7LAD0_9ARCH|nr:amidase family protein [Candidatus Methanoplasma termitum]AIZ55978.1 amidase [Candidatus Methanoplasma termitum]